MVLIFNSTVSSEISGTNFTPTRAITYTYIYIYRYVRHSFVARSWGDVMWEELSVSHF